MKDNLKGILIPAVIALAAITVLLIIRSITFRFLHRWAKKTETDIDDIIIGAFKTPSFYWCVAIGLHIGIAISGLPEQYIFYISKTIHIVVILSIASATAYPCGTIPTDRRFCEA